MKYKEISKRFLEHFIIYLFRNICQLSKNMPEVVYKNNENIKKLKSSIKTSSQHKNKEHINRALVT